METLFIDKKNFAETECIYDKFYKKGLELLQNYSGDIWTDYNPHDPGITILEQLCYALTELHYKSTFPVEDFVSSKNNKIPFDYLGLLHPEKIIPNGCVTINDFRKVLFDDIDEAGNIWIEYNKNDIAGLYTVYVDIADQFTLNDNLKQIVIDKIRRSFSKWRNLGEDIANVIVLEREPYEIHGEIEIHSDRSIGELYGDIYALCSEHITSNMFYRSVKELQIKGLQLFELFDGPLLKYGIILNSDLTERTRVITIPEIISKISKIEGVVEVNNLFLKNENHDIYDGFSYIENNRAKIIKLPESNDSIFIKLKSSGRTQNVNYHEIVDEVNKRLVNDPFYPDYLDDISKLYPNSQGVYREFNHYYSIQNDFPSIYGISENGLQGSEPSHRKGKARQLKAFLYFFEQIMANYLESLQNVKTLLSTDTDLNKSHFFNCLNNSNIPNIEELYTDNKLSFTDLENDLLKYDRFISRRNEVLDLMLGMYGLEFKQISLRHFLTSDKNGTVSKKIILNKIRYLQYASTLTIRLSKGINYLANVSDFDCMSGLELQTQLRTGNDPQDKNHDEKMLVIEHVLLRPLDNTLPQKAHWFYNSRITIVLPGHLGRFVNVQFRMLVMQIIEKSTPPHLFVDYIWCEKYQWDKFLTVYSLWIKSFIQENNRHDRVSLLLSRLLYKYGKVKNSEEINGEISI